jgi:3-oxoacyl-[acyl-carrier protein] reductase
MKKSILVTGASRGIGFQLVKLLSEQGHRVFALSRSIESLTILRESNEIYNSLIPISVDLSNQDLSAVKSVIKSIPLDALVNNAGLLINKPFLDLDVNEVLEMFKVNTISIYGITQLVFDNLKAAKGNVTNISSIGGVNGTSKFPGLSGYSSSKGSMITLTECMAEELKDNINVNALALGAVQTEMLEEAFPGYEANVSAKQMAVYIANFILNDAYLFNGKIISVGNSTP